jgi:hypothetical protein
MWFLLMMPGLVATSFADEERHWQRVMSGDRKVGLVEHHRIAEQDRVRVIEMLTLELGAPGRRDTYRVRLETETGPDGALRRMTRESRTRAGHSLVQARTEGDELIVEIGQAAPGATRKFQGASTLRGDEVARAWRLAVGSGQSPEPLRYRTFDPARVAIAEVELVNVTSAGGEPQVRRTWRVGGTESITLLTLDAQGREVDERLRIGSMDLRLVGSTEQEARARGAVLDHVAGQMQASPYRIPLGEMRAKIRYGFEHGGRPPAIPVGGGQRSWSDGTHTWIQVCASCAADPGELAPEQHRAAMMATPWLNFDAPALEKRARRVTRGATDPALKMRRLAAVVRNHMSAERIDMLGYGSALEAYRSRRGDCTEYAVLLAAMGRAAGVPTRVVSGLVYARRFEDRRHVFVPHAWVQAWTGNAWQSFDAALGRFDSTHLAFAVSYDGNPAELLAGINLAHQLRLSSAARVLPRPH